MKQIDKAIEAFELVLTDIEWSDNSPTKKVVIEALTALKETDHIVDGNKMVDALSCCADLIQDFCLNNGGVCLISDAHDLEHKIKQRLVKVVFKEIEEDHIGDHNKMVDVEVMAKDIHEIFDEKSIIAGKTIEGYQDILTILMAAEDKGYLYQHDMLRTLIYKIPFLEDALGDAWIKENGNKAVIKFDEGKDEYDRACAILNAARKYLEMEKNDG